MCQVGSLVNFHIDRTLFLVDCHEIVKFSQVMDLKENHVLT